MLHPPHVIHVEQNLFTCAQDTQDRVKSLIQEHRLNRVVVAACSPERMSPFSRRRFKLAV